MTENKSTSYRCYIQKKVLSNLCNLNTPVGKNLTASSASVYISSSTCVNGPSCG